VASKIGMWLFLFTELLLFGTLFIGFAVYLDKYRWDFQKGSEHLNRLIGATNTLILLTSSLTMALSIAALERGKKFLSLALQAVTIGFALAFLIIKGFEWYHKYQDHLFPKTDHMLTLPPGEQLFFGLYFTMTGLHALHVIVGGTAIVIAMRLVIRNRVRQDRIVFLSNVGLYWHLVDLIWIYLFPLFYLIG
jgi:cytochrome c oxidase subunit 3